MNETAHQIISGLAHDDQRAHFMPPIWTGTQEAAEEIAGKLTRAELDDWKYTPKAIEPNNSPAFYVIEIHDENGDYVGHW